MKHIREIYSVNPYKEKDGTDAYQVYVIDTFSIDPFTLEDIEILTRIKARLQLDKNNETVIEYKYNIEVTNGMYYSTLHKSTYKIENKIHSITLDSIAFMLYEAQELIGKAIENDEYLKNEVIRIYQRYKRTHTFKVESVAFWIEQMTNIVYKSLDTNLNFSTPTLHGNLYINCKYKGYYASVGGQIWFTGKHSRTVHYCYDFRIKHKKDDDKEYGDNTIKAEVPLNILEKYPSVRSKEAIEQMLRQSCLLDQVALQIKKKIETYESRLQQGV